VPAPFYGWAVSYLKTLAAVPLLLIAFGACEDSGTSGQTLNPNLDAGSVEIPTVDSSVADANKLLDAAAPDAADAADASLCGNGVVDPGETCDGNCPTSCSDSIACTTDVLVGTPSECNVACEHAATQCAGGDDCCAPGCDATNDSDCAFTVATEFKASYAVRTLGAAQGVVQPYGGLTVSKDDPNTLLISGAANSANGKVYAVHLQRDSKHHIVAIDGTATVFADAPYNDGGLVYAPNGALVYTRYSANELGFIRPFTSGIDAGADAGATDKVVALGPLGAQTSVGGLMLVPAGMPGAGRWKSVSYAGGQWNELTFADDGAGLYNVTAAAPRATLAGGPEGIAYVPAGSPLFPNPSLVVSEYSAQKIATYEVDANGDPVIASRRELITSLAGAEGAFIDPLSGDYLFSTFGGANKLLVVSGFAQ
jgi:hypothetical protein